MRQKTFVRKSQFLFLRLSLIMAAWVTTATIPLFAQNISHEKNPKSEKVKQRLEQLFVWRVSDRLGLSSEQEDKFAAQYKKVTDERAAIAQSMEETLDAIDKQNQTDTKDSAAAIKKLLAHYEAQQRKYNQTQTAEMELGRKLFTTKQLAEYVLLKREMTHRFRDLLSQGTGVSRNASSETPVASATSAAPAESVKPTESTEPTKAPQSEELSEPKVIQEK